MRKFICPLLVILLLIATATTAAAQAPRVLITKPADKATGVPLDIGEISVFFSIPMDTGSWSLFEVQGLEYPPAKIEGPPWKDEQTFVLNVQELKPGTKYGLQLNNDKRQGFKAKDGTPLPPLTFSFETAGQIAKKEPGTDDKKTPGNDENKEQEKKPGPLTEEEAIQLHFYGGIMGIFFHELGHGLIHMLNLPIIGREEDAVDEFSTMLMLMAREEGAERIPEMVLGFANIWRLWAKTEQRVPAWDEHSASDVRFADIMCLIFGSSPNEFGELAKKLGMPERRMYFCQKDYPKRQAAWEKMLHDHLKMNGAQGPGKLLVEYGEAKSEFSKKLEYAFKESKFFEHLAEGLTKAIAFPYDVTIVLKDLGEINCYWNPQDHQIVMGYELMKYWADLLEKENSGGGGDGGGGGGGDGGGGGGGGGGQQQSDNRLVGIWGARLDNQGMTYVTKMLFGQDGKYHIRDEQWRMGQLTYWEDEKGSYYADGQLVKFKVQQARPSQYPGTVYGYQYVVQGNQLVFKNVPILNGADLVMQRLQ